MKRRIFALLLVMALCLSGCSMLEREYSSVQPHSYSYYESEDRSVLRAESYQDLVNDILLLVASQDTDGKIWLYPGAEPLDSTEAAERACREVKQETPLGAYSVDYITYEVDDSSRNYSQITLTISYSRTPEQLSSIVHATDVAALYDLLTEAAGNGGDALVIQVGSFDRQAKEVRDTVKRVRQELSVADSEPWQVNFYPNDTAAGIIEILLRP